MNVIPPMLSNAIPDLSNDVSFFHFSPVSVQKVRYKTINPQHWHDYSQIWYTVSGSYYHTINGERRLQTPGSVSLIFPHTLHGVDTSLSDTENARIVYFSIREDMFSKNYMPFIPLTYSLASFDKFVLSPFITLRGKDKELADELCESSLSEFSKQLAMHSNKILNNCATLLELCAKTVNTPFSSNTLKMAQERAVHINNSVAYLKNNRTDKISIESASVHAMMSKSSFTEKFKTTVGRTHHDYLTRLRMAKAISLMRFSRKTIAEISDECGYANNSHFTRTCIEIFSVPPQVLRQQLVTWARGCEHVYMNQRRENSWAQILDSETIEDHRRIMLGID